MTMTIAFYFPFWKGPSTLNRALLENTFHLQSFDSFLAHLFPGIPLDTATTVGRLLFVPLYCYALVLSTRRGADFVRACFVTMFALLGLATSNVKIWYAIWPMSLAAGLRFVHRTAGLLMAMGATLSAAVFAYLYVWLGQTSSSFGTVNAIAYFITFVPAALFLVLSFVLTKRFIPVRGLADEGQADIHAREA